MVENAILVGLAAVVPFIAGCIAGFLVARAWFEEAS